MRIANAGWREAQLQMRRSSPSPDAKRKTYAKSYDGGAYARLEPLRPSIMADTAEAAAAVVGLTAFNAAFKTPLCGAIFSCGCTWPWTGGSAGCNSAAGSTPAARVCPWCAASPLAAQLTALHLYAIVGYMVARLREARPWLRLLVVPLLTWLAAGVAVAGLFKLVIQPEYPYYLWVHPGWREEWRRAATELLARWQPRGGPAAND